MRTGQPGLPSPAAHPTSGSTVRLGWLDALRGIAALVVALHHGTYEYLPQFRHEILYFLDPGDCGVLLFFLVSGYIIPASLERTGSVRRFWISRAFRIYPLLLVVLAAVLILDLTGLKAMRAGTLDAYEPVGAVLAHLTMMQDLLAVPNAVNVLWTLSFEMAFYLLVVGLFGLGGLHRRSVTITVVLAVAA
ncbi:acyltransferase family protein, partial [Actinomadura adrarensis]